MKKLAAAVLALLISACASHPSIEVPAPGSARPSRLQNASVSYEILYSQPQPGLFSDGALLPLTPLAQAQLSLGSSSVLKSLPAFIAQRIPARTVTDQAIGAQPW